MDQQLVKMEVFAYSVPMEITFTADVPLVLLENVVMRVSFISKFVILLKKLNGIKIKDSLKII